MVDFNSMSREQVEQFSAAAQGEWGGRTHVWKLRERFDWQWREFERLAALQGPVPASPIPEGGFMPGQIVDDDGTLYLNGSGGVIDYAPGDEPLSEWVHVEEPPEPGDPEPEPAPPAPEHEPWQQPTGAHDTYPIGAIVTHDGHLWENTIDRNGWEPGTPHSQWTDLGPVT